MTLNLNLNLNLKNKAEATMQGVKLGAILDASIDEWSLSAITRL